MKTEIREKKWSGNVELVEYDSLQEFYNYIMKTPYNESFKDVQKSSIEAPEFFAKTNSFEEAVELFLNGWSEMASKLNQNLKALEKTVQPHKRPKSTLGVVGYQPVVPLYLQGVPRNMVNNKMVPVKQKVITLNKSISYNSSTSTGQIETESVKALQIIKKLESQGYRCNLNIILGLEGRDRKKDYVIKIRIKSATEKLNISKMAFPLVHPSMLRRLFFRWVETYPSVPKCYVNGYGGAMEADFLRSYSEGEYLLPQFIRKDVNKINNIDDLDKLESYPI